MNKVDCCCISNEEAHEILKEMDTNYYGICNKCETPLKADWFIDTEFSPKSNAPTGRTRLAVNFLYCPCCGKKYLVDDTFDGAWHY